MELCFQRSLFHQSYHQSFFLFQNNPCASRFTPQKKSVLAYQNQVCSMWLLNSYGVEEPYFLILNQRRLAIHSHFCKESYHLIVIFFQSMRMLQSTFRLRQFCCSLHLCLVVFAKFDNFLGKKPEFQDLNLLRHDCLLKPKLQNCLRISSLFLPLALKLELKS